MRYRIGIANNLYIGRQIGTDFELDNEISKFNEEQKELLNSITKDFIEQFDSEEKGYKLGGYDRCDFGWNDKVFEVGLEPSYIWDKLLIFRFDLENKDNSIVLYGTAFGYYGTKIAVKTRYLKNYKRKSKFANFINKWYEKVWEVLK